jgi:hypothetical protein
MTTGEVMQTITFRYGVCQHVASVSRNGSQYTASIDSDSNYVAVALNGKPTEFIRMDHVRPGLMLQAAQRVLVLQGYSGS